MNFKTTIVLVLLVLAAGLYFFVFERDRPATRQRQPQPEADGTPLFHDRPLSPDAVTRITIERGDESTVLERDGETWRQAEPVTFPLREHEVTQLLSAAAELRYTQLLAPEVDGPSAAEAGLEPPRVTLTLDDGEHARELRLGRRAPGGHGYLMLDDHPEIHLVDDALHAHVLDQTVRDWRRREIETPAAAAVERLSIAGADRAVELHKDTGRWYLDPERSQRASESAVEALTEALGEARIASFADDAPEDPGLFGLDAPHLTVTLHTPAMDDEGEPTGTEPHTLRVGSTTDLEGDERFATWSVGETPSPVVFTLRTTDLEALQPEVDDLRDPHILTTAPREINALEVERTEHATLHLVRRRDRGFDFGDPDPGYRADYDAVTGLLEDLAGIEAEAFDVGVEPADDPVATVRITPRGGAEPETVRFYATDEPEQYQSLREGESVAHTVAHDRIAPLFQPRVAFRDRDVLEVEPAELAQVTLERDDGVTFSFLREDDQWALKGHETFDGDALESLLDGLSPLRAQRWAVDPDDAPASDARWAVLTLERAEASPRVLRVDPATRLAQLEGLEPPFVVPAAVAEAMAGEYRDRVLLSVRQAEIDSVTLGWADDAATLARDDDGRYVAEDGRSVNQGAAGRLFDTLAGLRVARYEAVEPDELPEPTLRLTVRVQDERSHELAIITPQTDEQDAQAQAEHERLAIFDDRVVQLRERDIDRLTAEVVGEPGTADDAEHVK